MYPVHTPRPFRVRLELSQGATFMSAIVNLRFASGGPIHLFVLAFDTLNSFQLLASATVNSPSLDPIRGVDLAATPTEIDNARWSYSLHWGPSWAAAAPLGHPPDLPVPEQLLWVRVSALGLLRGSANAIKSAALRYFFRSLFSS